MEGIGRAFRYNRNRGVLLRNAILGESKQLLKLGLPVIGAQLAQIFMSFTDTVMAGNLSPADLAAVAFGSNLVFPLYLFSVGVLMAVNPMVGHKVGAGKLEETGPIVRQTLLFSLGLAALNILITRNLEWAPGLVGIDPELHPKALGYVEAFGFGVPAALASTALRFSNDGMGKTKPGMVVAMLALPANALLNWVFMYGKFGAPAMGAVGTGWATATVNWLQFLMMAGYCLKAAHFKPLHLLRGSWQVNGSILKEIARIGIPSGLSFGLEVSLFALVSLLMGKLGTQAIASHQIAMNVASITFMVPLGMATAITIRVGQFTGAGQHAAAAFSGRIGIGLSALIMSVFALAMFSIPHAIAGVYTDDAGLITLAAGLLQLAGIFQIFDGLQVAGSGALRGLKDTRIPMLVNFCAYWLVGLNLGYWLGLHFGYGAKGLWAGLIAGLTVAGILHNIRFNYLIERRTTTPNT
jgi:MATE family multidrug resistance protein